MVAGASSKCARRRGENHSRKQYTNQGGKADWLLEQGIGPGPVGFVVRGNCSTWMESFARGPRFTRSGFVSQPIGAQPGMDAAFHGCVQGSAGSAWEDNDGAASVPDATR